MVASSLIECSVNWKTTLQVPIPGGSEPRHTLKRHVGVEGIKLSLIELVFCELDNSRRQAFAHVQKIPLATPTGALLKPTMF